ncbi:DNA cytosine methyltransferase [Lentibacillus sp. Marseille-P4043]|uniref:DNA cytosine methyltransferase n=1 Tax=Lentibacillus sp. Marseille-P4043 TaxID=2040293 RepID=UPI0018F89DA0|nr:DNA cytosine methyltransferase [Lentibacillus sp. Marseille-P4043]
MLYQFKDIYSDQKAKKAYINEIIEIFNILKLTVPSREQLNEPQMSLEGLGGIQQLIKIGIINSEKEMTELKNIINKNCKFSFDEFFQYIKDLDQKYNTEQIDCKSCPINSYCESYRKLIIKEEEKHSNKPTLMDLFCGAGGMSLGFKQEGFRISFANDIEQCCIDTYIHNHPEVPKKYIFQNDINNIIPDIKKYVRYSTTDVIIGGPPCQGFSNANRQRIIDDPRNKLYKAFVQIVNKIQPKFFVMENVAGMKTVATQVVEDFKSIGYDVTFDILNSYDFGVPQNRKRLIFIGNRMGVNNEKAFEEIKELNKHKNKHVLEDAISNLRPLTASRIKNSTELDTEEHGRKVDYNPFFEIESDYQLLINNCTDSIPYVFNHKARYNNDRDIEIFGRLHQGNKSDDPKIADIMPYQSRNNIFKDKYYKLENNKPSKTITAHMKFDCNMYIHPTQARGLTPREAARIQTYPDYYMFKGPYTKTYMQIGNSVPPLMSRGIAEVLKKYI